MRATPLLLALTLLGCDQPEHPTPSATQSTRTTSTHRGVGWNYSQPDTTRAVQLTPTHKAGKPPHAAKLAASARPGKPPHPSKPAANQKPTSSGKVATTQTPSKPKALPRANTPLPPVIPLPGPDHPPTIQLGSPNLNASAAEWRAYADLCVKRRAFAAAATAYAQEAAIYKVKGDPDAAAVETMKAARYRTQIELYAWRPSRDDAPRKRARLEPISGCMVGAFIDRDDTLETQQFGNQTFGDVDEFNQRVGKAHASFFTYLSFSNTFPSQWADYLRQHNAVPHLAWEPRDLSEVTDERLASFTRALQAYNGPVILRFASEMNGKWTRYHGDPARYRQTFRRVYAATRKARNAAMLWCPNAIPSDDIAKYYPGDDGCDWVGVNFYNVPFLDNDPSRPGDWIHPADFLEPVYAAYAQRKPIAIGEYAASHEAAARRSAVRTDFARLKMAQLYQSLPLKYPGVKLVSWYDCNNMRKARQERQLNNFQLTDDRDVFKAYQNWVAQPYFLAAGESQAPREAAPFPAVLHGSVEVETWVRSYEGDPRVFLRLDGRTIQQSRLPLTGRFTLSEMPPGAHQIDVLVYDARNTLADRRSWKFRVE